MTQRLTNERKRRADAWEVRAGLTDGEQRKIFGWARSLGYARALDLVRAEFPQVDPLPALSTFADWYTWQAGLESEERVHRAIVDAGAIGDLARQSGGVSEALVGALEAEASAAILGGDPERIKLLVSLALKAREGRFEERKYKDAMKTSIERGLDALAEEAQGNSDAMMYYAKFRESILRTVEESK